MTVRKVREPELGAGTGREGGGHSGGYNITQFDLNYCH